MRGRVRHRRTGAPGDAVEQLTGREGTVLPGPWSRVQFDDGLECWCPDDELEELPTRAELVEIWRGTLDVGAARYDEMVAAVAATIDRADIALDRRAVVRQLLVDSADAFRDAVLAWERLAEVDR